MASAIHGRFSLALLLGTLSAFGPFVIDLYLPALPQLAEFFHTSAPMTQLSLTTAMIGLAAGQLLLGPVSDKWGRKRPLLLSLLAYAAATVLLIFSPTIEIFVLLRGIQGLSAAGGVVISRAIAADLYRGREMTRFFGLLMTVNGMAPIVSPVLGSILLEYMDWRGIFFFLTLLGVGLFALCLRLGESLRNEDRVQEGIFASFRVFGKMCRNFLFMCFVLMESFAFAGMFAYIAASPFLFQTFYGVSPLVFSLCFAANGAALALGSHIGGRLADRISLSAGCGGIFVLSACVFVCLSLRAHVALVEAGFFGLLFCSGVILPAVSALAMEAGRRHAGSASALLGVFPFLVGAVVSPLAGIGDIFHSTALLIASSGLATLATYLLVRRQVRG